MTKINKNISIDPKDIDENFILSSGAGGQNVNKNATAVQLRYRIDGKSPLPEEMRKRLAKIAGSKLSSEGCIVIEAKRFRNQKKNRDDAMRRLKQLVRKAAVKPKRRRPTKPSKASVKRRIDTKKKHASLKSLRRRPATDE